MREEGKTGLSDARHTSLSWIVGMLKRGDVSEQEVGPIRGEDGGKMRQCARGNEIDT